MTYISSATRIGDIQLPSTMEELARFLQESVGSGAVRVLASDARDLLSCACSPQPLKDIHAEAARTSNVEIAPVPYCTLLSQGMWNILCQSGTAPKTQVETLCAATSIEGLGAVAVQADVSHFARQDFRYRRLCARSLHFGLVMVTSLLENHRSLERARQREEQARNVIRSNAAAREEERARISFQLHDGAVQSLVSVLHMVGALKEATTQQPEQSALLQKSEELLSQAIREIRGIINSLHTPNSGSGRSG
jgi:signal transduction histidine kinase